MLETILGYAFIIGFSALLLFLLMVPMFSFPSSAPKPRRTNGAPKKP